jgi:hypothetical protein
LSVDGDIELVPSITDTDIRAVRVTVAETLTHALPLKAALDERVRRGVALKDCTDDDDRDRFPLTDIAADFEELRVALEDFEFDTDDDDVNDAFDERVNRILFVGIVVLEDETVAIDIECVAPALTESLALIDRIDDIDILGDVLYESRVDGESTRETVLCGDCVTDTDDETEANPSVSVTVCVTDAITEIETIVDTLERGDADDDSVGVNDDSVVTVAMPPVNVAMDDMVLNTVCDPVYETVTLNDSVCSLDSEDDGVRFEVSDK